MNIETPSPYQPPAHLHNTVDSEQVCSTKRLTKLGWLALALSATGLLVPALILALASLDVIDIAWNSKLPERTLFICGPLTLAGLICSIFAYVKSRSWTVVLGIVFAVTAILGCLALTAILIAMQVAGHPV